MERVLYQRFCKGLTDELSRKTGVFRKRTAPGACGIQSRASCTEYDWRSPSAYHTTAGVPGRLRPEREVYSPLGRMAAGFTTYYLYVVLVRLRAEIVAGKIRALRLRQVHG